MAKGLPSCPRDSVGQFLVFLGSTILLHNERSESPSHLTALRTPSSPSAPSSSRKCPAHSLLEPFLYPGPTKGCWVPPFNSDLSGAGLDEADGTTNTLLPFTGRSGLVILEVIFRFPTLAFPNQALTPIPGVGVSMVACNSSHEPAFCTCFYNISFTGLVFQCSDPHLLLCLLPFFTQPLASSLTRLIRARRNRFPSLVGSILPCSKLILRPPPAVPGSPIVPGLGTCV